MRHKRPKTTHSSYSLDAKARANAPMQCEGNGLPEISDKIKKWQEVSKQLVRELQLCRFVNKNASHRSLHKVGGGSYVSQSIKEQQKEPSTPVIFKQNNVAKSKKIVQNFRIGEKNKKIIKRISRQILQSRATVQFDRPVLNIGSHMQNEQRLTYHHIQNLQKIQKIQPRLLPIVYSIKNDREVYSAGMNMFKNDDISICISLFAQCLDAKPQESTKKREVYFKQMLKQMNGTYDPQIMSKMPLLNKKPPFNSKQYFTYLSKFEIPITNNDRLYINYIINGVINKIHLNIEENRVDKIRTQIMNNLREGISIANFDYFLKDGANCKKMGRLRQYLVAKKQLITSYRINYHGGYSKTLYNNWHGYVTNGQTELSKRNYIFSPKIQKVNSWLSCFNDLNLIETSLFQIMLYPISIHQMKQIQFIKIHQVFSIFENICIKGILTILQYNRILKLEENMREQYRFLRVLKKVEYIIPQNDLTKGILCLQEKNQSQLIDWYETLFQRRHTKIDISGMEDLIQLDHEENEILDTEKKKINKSIEVLINIFYTKLIEKSLFSFFNLFTNCSKPILKLLLIVDRQSLKLNETEQKIIEVFTIIINEILRKSISYTSMGMRIRQFEEDTQFPEFGNLHIAKKEEQTTRVNNAWQLNIVYKYPDMNQKQIKNLLCKIKGWYHECQQLIQSFSAFMPFIKLTAKQKLFLHNDSSDWERIEEIFVINLDKVKYYRAKLNEIAKKVNVGVFQVDCSQPIKVLHDRISEMEYLLQQKYLSQIFQKIHEMELKLAEIRSSIHSCNLKLNTAEHIKQIFQNSKDQLFEMKEQTKELAKHIYFYIQKHFKSNTLITRFNQLIVKRTQLMAEIQVLRDKIKQDFEFLEARREEHRRKFVLQINTFEQKLKNSCKQYLQINRLQRYLNILKRIKKDFIELKQQLLNLKDANYNYENEIKLLNKTQKCIENVFNYWSQMNVFNNIIRTMNKEKIKWIELKEYEKIVKESEKAIEQFEDLGLETNQINRPHLITFKQDVVRHKQNLEYLKILTDNEILLDYFADYGCDQLLNLTFKQLISSQDFEKRKETLKQLQTKAKTQNWVWKKFSQIKQRFISLKLSIVDRGGTDTLQPEDTSQTAQILKQSSFECEKLLKNKYSEKYKNEINLLRQNMSKCQEILLQWLEMEGKFLQLHAFYKKNDDAYFIDDFTRITEIHRKIIKSFDANNSVFYLPTNAFLSVSLVTGNQSLDQLKKQIYQKFNRLQSQQSRLQLLNHDELLRMTSDISTVPKYLPKCFPTFQTIAITEERIDRIGGYVSTKIAESGKFKKIESISGNFIELSDPISLSSRLLNVNKWVEKLSSQIKQCMKYMFFFSKKELCLQLFLLKQQLQFTQFIEEILSSEEDIPKKLQNYSRTLVAKIEQRRRTDPEKYICVMKILLLIAQRDIISSLIQSMQSSILSVNSFDWLKNCRFYNHSETENKNKKIIKADVKMLVVNETFDYNFFFIEKCEMVIQDTLFIGNCVVGKQGSGKKSLIKNYAYLTGNELFQFERGRISQNFTENVVNFYKLAITKGSWLMIPDINLMNTEELKVVAECLSSIIKARNSKSQKMNMFVYTEFEVNPNCRIFFTLQNFQAIPSRLSHNFRPIWICPPSTQFISSIYNEAIGLIQSDLPKHMIDYLSEHGNAYTFKFVDFIYWNRENEEVPLYFSQSMLLQYWNQTQQYPIKTHSKFLSSLLGYKFLYSEDLGQTNQKQDINWIVQNFSYSIIYIDQSKVINFISTFFSQTQTIQLNLQQANFKNLQQRITYIKSRLKKDKISYLLLQNSLKNHHNIQKQINHDDLMSKLKIIYFENPNNLYRDQKFRLINKLSTIIIKNNPKQISLQKENTNKPKKLQFKKNIIGDLSIYPEVDVQSQRIINKLIDKLLKYKYQQSKIIEIRGWFEKLRVKAIERGYSKQVALIFGISWIFGNYISQRELIKELSKLKELSSYHDIISACTNLRELYPLKNGFLTTFEQLTETNQLKLNEGIFEFRSNMISNIKLVRSLLKQDLFVINSQFTTQQIANLIFPDSFHLYCTELTSQLQTKNILEHILKIGDQNQINHFVIHAADKLQSETFQLIKEYARKGCTQYVEMGSFKLFKSNKCQFTFIASKEIIIPDTTYFGLNLSHNDIAAYEQDQLQIILKRQLTPNFCQSVLRGIINCYRTCIKKYFWLQYPIRAALKKGLRINDMGDQFFMWLLRYMFLCIPDERTKLITEICYYSTPISLVKHESLQYQIQMSTLIQTKTYMEKLLTKTELEARKNICRDLLLLSSNCTPYSYQMLFRTFLAVSDFHTVLLGKTFTQRYYCLEVVARILGIQIVPFKLQLFTSPSKTQHVNKSIVLLKQADINWKTLTVLQSLICQQESFVNKQYTVVLKLNENSPDTIQYYKNFPFLKKYFVHVHFPTSTKQEVQRNINLVKTLKNLQSGQNKYELSIPNQWDIPPELQVQKSISNYFQGELNKKFGFLVKLLEIRKQIQQEQFNKYKFYRSLTEQLFYILSMLGIQLNFIPSKIQEINKRIIQLEINDGQINEENKKITERIDSLEKQLGTLKEQTNSKIKEYQQLKLKTITTNEEMENTFNKIYAKLDNLSIQENSKFKATDDNELTNPIYTFIATLIRWEPGKLKKIPSKQLKTALKENNIRTEKNKEMIRKILTNWKSQKKKNIYIGNIFIILTEWIQAVDYYHFKTYEDYIKTEQLKKQREVEILNLKSQIIRYEEKIAHAHKQLKMCQELKVSNQKEINGITEKKATLKSRSVRIDQILKQVVEKEYKLKISKDLAQRLYYIPKIIMSKSIFQMWLNEFEDNDFIARELFLKTNKEEEVIYVKDQELFKFNLPLFYNIFDDFDSIVNAYNKYKLEGMDYDQVKLIHAIITNRHRIQMIEDSYGIISEKLCQVCGSYLDFKVLDLSNMNLANVKKQIIQKSINYTKILITLSRYDKEQGINSILSTMMEICNTHQQIKFIILFEKFEPLSGTDNFRSLLDGKVCLTFRRYLRQFAKIVYQKQLPNQWEYYQSQYEFNKAHKMLFEVVEKFQPENDESYNKMVAVIKRLEEARQKRFKNYEIYEEYHEYLETISYEFGNYFLFLKFLEQLDRYNPINLFENDNIFKNFQVALKKVMLERDSKQQVEETELLRRFIVHISYLINFLDENQLNKFCLFSAFLLAKPKQFSCYFIIKLIRKSQVYRKESQRAQFIIKEAICMDIDITKLQYKLMRGNLQGLCEEWLEYLIFATSSSSIDVSEGFLKRMSKPQWVQILEEIKQRTNFPMQHYFVVKTKLEFRNELRVPSTSSRQRESKTFWVIKLVKEQSQKLMQILENRVISLKQQVKLLNFFFNQSKYEANFLKLKQLSHEKVFVCIFNLNKDKHNIIDEIVTGLLKNNTINPLFKVFIITQDRILLKNRQNIDYIQFTIPQSSSEQQKFKISQQLISQTLASIPNPKLLKQNCNILNSLHVIVDKCTQKLNARSEKSKIYYFLINQLINSSILNTQNNVGKFVKEYFKVSKIQMDEILEYCKIKEPLMIFEQPKSMAFKAKSTQYLSEDVNKWVNLLNQLQGCTLLMPIYLNVIKTELNRIIEQLLRGQSVKIVINEIQLKNIIKFGWIKIESWEVFKFLLYKGLKNALQQSAYEDSYETIRELKIICEKDDRRISLKLDQFNELFDNEDVVQEHELKIKPVQQPHQEVLIQKNDIENILEHYNVRLGLNGSKQTLGSLLVNFK